MEIVVVVLDNKKDKGKVGGARRQQTTRQIKSWGKIAMTPFDAAIAIYDREPCFRTFDEDLRLHLAHGYVVSTPRVFVMARAVESKGADSMIVDPAMNGWLFPDCWHVHILAGDMAEALSFMPFELPLVSFQRKNVLRFWPLASIKRLTRHETLSSRPPV